jgi:hypothetical protein
MSWTRRASLVAAGWLVATALAAQTTGRIEGRIVDDAGALLPGVAVVATGPSLPGEARTQSADDGSFRLVNLPPGLYTVSAALDGFNTVEQRDVKVGIDRTVRLEMTMVAAFTGEVTVLSEAPVVDVTNATSGVSVSAETFEKLPLARDFYAVAQIASGAATDAVGTTFYGSTGAENQYVIEGLNTTGGRYGDEGKTLNFDFIQEVEVKTGGLPAEYGRLTGGLINAITRSGGNEIEGSAFGFYQGGDLQSDNSTASETPETQATVQDIDSQYDVGFTLGGAFVQDKLWYFAAYNRQNRTDATTIIRDIQPVPGFESPPPVGSVVDADTSSDLYSAKLTWRITPNQSLAASVIGDPASTDGAVFPVGGPESTYDGEQDFGSDDLLARYDAVLGSSWVVEGLIGLHQEESRFAGGGKDLPLYIDQRGPRPFPTAGGYGFHEDQETEREVMKVDVSKFLGRFELKFGADRENVGIDTEIWNGGAGQRIYLFNNRATAGGPTVYRHRFYVDESAPGFDRDDPSTWRLAAPLAAAPDSVNDSAYGQLSWKASPTLTVNAGVRWEAQEVRDRNGDAAIEIDDNWAPRLQVVWDPTADGRSKVFGSFGRYYESIPLDINVRAFGGETQCFCYNFSPDPNDISPAPDAETGFRSSLLGGATPVDPDLEGQYVDEYLVGYEYEVAPNFVLGVQGTYRELGSVIEDFLIISEGNYFIANPGQGLGRVATFYDYSEVPAEEARREYTGVELNARKRYSNGWQLYASYLWSELEGNYDGVFQASTGQLDPNINSAFDYADFLINADGKLTNDREHSFKVNGSYTLLEGPLAELTVGLSAYFRTGTPLTAYGYSFAYSNWEYYLTPRGALGRNPDEYEADLHVSYPLDLGPGQLELQLDVFNLLDRQSVTVLDQRYNLQDARCAGIPDEICNGDGGLLHDGESTDPVGGIPDPRATATNPDFLRAGAAFTGQRSLRLGLRYRF